MWLPRLGFGLNPACIASPKPMPNPILTLTRCGYPGSEAEALLWASAAQFVKARHTPTSTPTATPTPTPTPTPNQARLQTSADAQRMANCRGHEQVSE